jgi:hypothetical protein
MVAFMDSEKNNLVVEINSSFFLRFGLFLLAMMVIFYFLAPYYISLKLAIIKPALDILYGQHTAPYIRSIPAYRGLSISLVCFFSLIAASLYKRNVLEFFQKQWIKLIGFTVIIILYEIIAVLIEIVSTGLIGYYITALLLSVSSIIIALLLWFLLFPSLRRYFNQI